MLALGSIWNSRTMSLDLRMVLVVGLTALGAAVSTAPAFAACAALPAGAPVVSPGDLLGRFPSGGGGMVSEVRNMVATNPGSVDGIGAILGAASADQKQAIGAGLGQAAGLCTRQEPDSARRIQEAVLRMNNSDVSTAFQTVTGDRQTAATGGGGGGAGGGGGGGGTGVSGSSTAGGTSPVIPTSTSSFANSGLTFSAGSAVSAGPATTRTLAGTTTTTASPASTAASPATIVSSPATTSSINR